MLYRNLMARGIFRNRYLLPKRLFCSDDKTNGNKSFNETVPQDEISANSKRHEKPSSNADVQENAKKKILSLLSEIKDMTNERSEKMSNLNLAKPPKRPARRERILQMQKERETPKDEMKEAVKAVATSFPGDAPRIVNELDAKLKALRLTQEKLPADQAQQKDEQINKIAENLIPPVKEVAATISESSIPSRSELTTRLLRLSLDKKVSPKNKKSVLSVIESMKLKSLKKEKKPYFGKRTVLNDIKSLDLFGSPPLNIFNLDSESVTEYKSPLWQAMQKRELKLLTQFAPTNAFEEMIMWTEQGKHWKFPIDNETEMGEEEKYGFHEHVFLEHHLKGFPAKGPIRHFMELVVVGMSKNPYITVDRKIENIEWFRNYFKEKEEILERSGVLE